MKATLLNTPVYGFIIYGFTRIRNVQLIELRNGFNRDFDKSVGFFLEQMGNSVYSNSIDLKKFETVKELSYKFAIYSIHYYANDLHKLVEELDGLFDYSLIVHSQDIVKDYFLAKKEFHECSNSYTYCRIEDIPNLIEVPREHFLVKELGSIAA